MAFTQRKGIEISEKKGDEPPKGPEIEYPILGIPRHNGGPRISKKS